MHVLIYIAMLLAICGSSASFEENRKELLSSIANSSVGEPMRFDSDTYMLSCVPLYVDGSFVTWVAEAHDVGNDIYVFQCVEESENSTLLSPGDKLGYMDEHLYLLDRDDNYKPKGLDIPLLGYFSNPSFCKDNIAYWGLEVESEKGNYGHETYLMVYDLNKRLVINKTPIGKLLLETDSMGHLAVPVWYKDCGRVRFYEHEYMQKPVVLSVPTESYRHIDN